MPSTRRRRISGVGFRIYTYLSLLLILAPAAWLLISVVTHALPHWKWGVVMSVHVDAFRGEKPE